MPGTPYFDRTYFDPAYFDTNAAVASGHGGRSPNHVRRRQQRLDRSMPLAPVPIGIQDDEDLFGGMT